MHSDALKPPVMAARTLGLMGREAETREVTCVSRGFRVRSRVPYKHGGREKGPSELIAPDLGGGGCADTSRRAQCDAECQDAVISGRCSLYATRRGCRGTIGEGLVDAVKVAVADAGAIVNLHSEGVRESGFSQCSGPAYIQEGPELYRKSRNKGGAHHAGHDGCNNWGPNGGRALQAMSRLSGPHIPRGVIGGQGCMRRDPRCAHQMRHSAPRALMLGGAWCPYLA